MRTEDGIRKRKRKRKRCRKKRNGKEMIFVFVILLVITGILGCFVVGTIRRVFFHRIDVVLDAGHGGKDPGANRDDAIEKEITLEIAKMTKSLLKESGYKVGMVRDTDQYVKLEDRFRFANERKAKVFVSVHCNSSEDCAGRGIETYYTEQKGFEDKMLAEMIQEALIKETDANDRGVKTANYRVIAGSDMPAALVEAGFLTDAAERALLQEKEYQWKLARGIAEGIKRYLQSLQ